jgi:hypothetical protein
LFVCHGRCGIMFGPLDFGAIIWGRPRCWGIVWLGRGGMLEFGEGTRDIAWNGKVYGSFLVVLLEFYTTIQVAFPVDGKWIVQDWPT